MNFKNVIKLLIPSSFMDIWKGQRVGFNSDYYWEGIYRDFTKVPAASNAFNGDLWGLETFKHTRQLLGEAKAAGIKSEMVVEEQSLLPLLASTIAAASGKVRILDFGGGMGKSFIYLGCAVADADSIDYHVVETEKVCEGGRRLFAGDNRIEFYPSLPEKLTGIDIIYLDSVLQYIPDYSSLLLKLCRLQPQYFFFSRLSAGDIPTYASCQRNLQGETIPYWFINLEEILRLMSGGGYRLIFRGVSEREYDQGNFPEKYRLGRTCNLLFTRVPQAGPPRKADAVSVE